MLKKITLCFFGLSSAFSINANAEQNRWTIRASIGQNTASEVETVSVTPVAAISREVGFDTDNEVNIGIAVGAVVYQAKDGDSVRLSLNYGHSNNGIQSVRFMQNTFIQGDGDSAGDVAIDTFTARIAYHLDAGKYDPYIGIGVGIGEVDIEARYARSVNASSTTPPFLRGNDTALALEFILGMEYDISKNYRLFLEYNYTDISEFEFTRTGNGPGGLATTHHRDDYNIHSGNIGLSYQF